MAERMRIVVAAAMALATGSALAAPPPPRPHNVILFVADGLRAQSVTPETAPAMAALAAKGVFFRNSHSVYPTLTTVNAAALATGHLPGDTGEFGNTLYFGFVSRCPRPGGGVIGAVSIVENDCVLGDLNDHLGGENYLSETSVLAAAAAKGYSTASVGKTGPVAIQDVRQTVRLGDSTLIVDDNSGKAAAQGYRLPDDVAAALRAAGLPDEALGRADNAESGDANVRGTHFANDYQQAWFAALTTRVLLPRFKAAGKPFALVFWSRDPDGTQHGQGDSFQSLTPGINGPTSKAAIRNADSDLAAILEALRTLGLADSTDVIVTADHGFSTIARASKTSATVQGAYDGTRYGELAPGFVAVDVAKALGLPLWDASAMSKPEAAEPLDAAKQAPREGGLIGRDPTAPQVVVAQNGGSDLVYVFGDDARALTAKAVAALQAQDYVGALFVRDDLGPLPGTLRFSDIGFLGTGQTVKPAIVVGFRSFVVPGCQGTPLMCAGEAADTPLQTGQGMHGSPSRADTNNFMAAIGPDFRQGSVDALPAGNADLGRTLAHLLELKIAPRGGLRGRVLTEALVGGAEPAVQPRTLRSAATADGRIMVLNGWTADGVNYMDAAGYPGRVVGVTP